MTLETALWILAAAVPPCLAWGGWVTRQLMCIREDSSKLLEMHYNPDAYGFGTGNTNDEVKALCRSINSLVYYIKVDIENRTGIKPPPPLGEDFETGK